MNPDVILKELTSLPTASAAEQRVIAWIEQWAEKNKLDLKRDRYGNLLISGPGAVKTNKPLLITAHMDHPAFVVNKKLGKNKVIGEFRGGVDKPYFVGSRVRIVTADGDAKGVVVSVGNKPPEPWSRFRVTVELDAPCDAIAPGDVMVWDLPATTIDGDVVRGPAFDDLAAGSGAIAAFETLLKKHPETLAYTRLLFTRCEEIGFVGAIGACKANLIPKGARIVALETSKSFPESPIGGGPIVRVGDRTSIFDQELTYRVTAIAEALAKRTAKRKSPFRFQRKLMPGGTCEATAYQVYNRIATCVCIPLGNYHNMNESRGAIDSEQISLNDFHLLIEFLVEIARQIDAGGEAMSLHSKIEQIWEARRELLE